MSMTRRFMKQGCLLPVSVKIEDGKPRYPSPIRWKTEPVPDEATWLANMAKWQPREGHGVAVHLGRAGLLLVDLDRKNGHDGLKEYTEQIGPIPTTLSAATPSGGIHLYFRLPPALQVAGRDQVTGLLPGVDVKWANQIAVCPPTARPDGQYVWVDEIDPLPAPERLLGLIQQAFLASGDQTRHGVAEILSAGSDRGRRDNDLRDLVWHLLHRHGANPEGQAAAMATALEWNRDKCRPPLGETRVREMVARAFAKRREVGSWSILPTQSDPWESSYLAGRAGDDQVGLSMRLMRPGASTIRSLDVTSMAAMVGGNWWQLGTQLGLRVDNSYWRNRVAGELFNAIVGLAGSCPISQPDIAQVLSGMIEVLSLEQIGRISVVGGDEAMPETTMREEWLVEGLFQKNVTNLLVANGGIGKTTLALAVAHAVASGETVNEEDAIEPSCQAPCFYYTAEDDWQALALRSEMLRQGRSMRHFRLADQIDGEWRLFDLLRRLEGEEAEDHVRVVDSISAIYSGDPNDSARVVAFMRGFREVGGTTILIAHPSRAAMVAGRGDPLGSVQWRNQARHAIKLEVDEEDKSVIHCLVEKHNCGLTSFGSVLTLQRKVVRNVSITYVGTDTPTATAQVMIALRAGQRKPSDVYSWARQEYKSSEASLRRAKDRLVASGKLVQIHGNLYSSAEAEVMKLWGETSD